MDGMFTDDSSAIEITTGGNAAPRYLTTENSPRLLLVDDEPRLLSSLCALLKDRGYQMLTAACGAETIELLTKLQFDLVLLDLRLPDIGGHEIMDFINARGIDTKVIVLSGDTGIEAAVSPCALKARKNFTATSSIARRISFIRLTRRGDSHSSMIACSSYSVMARRIWSAGTIRFWSTMRISNVLDMYSMNVA